MIVTLKSFSQQVDLEDPSKVDHYMVFDADGRTIQLPVPESTIQALVAILYGAGAHTAEEEELVEASKGYAKAPAEDEEEAEVFGGGEGPEEAEEETEDDSLSYGSEDDIPSI
jgi:hypothetical protein